MLASKERISDEGDTVRKQVLIAVGAVIVVIGIVLGWYFLTQRHLGHMIAQGKRTNVLIMGIDNAGENRRSDTMMLLSIAPDRHVSLLSLPRDLRVKFNGEFHKLNAAYAIGGPDLARHVVSSLLGVDVPFYLTLDYTGFEHLIDAIGGVTITVDEAMHYDDNRATPPLHIDIKPGRQRMDGKTALDYIRFRSDPAGDLGRIKRQQKLIHALLNTGMQNKDLKTARTLIQTVRPYLHTDLSLIDLYDLAKILHGVNASQIAMATVPTTPVTIDKISFLEPRVVDMERIVARMIKGIEILTPAEVKVAVFNGNGGRMLATTTADYLKARDFVITRVANAESFSYPRTYIVVLTDAKKADLLNAALPQAATIVTPDKFSPHYAALKGLVPAGTDLLLIAGKGFAVGGTATNG